MSKYPFNQYNPSSKNKSKLIDLTKKPLEQTSFEQIKNISNPFPFKSKSILETNSNNSQSNPFNSFNIFKNNSSENIENKSSDNQKKVKFSQENTDGTKISKTKTTYVITEEKGELSEKERKEKLNIRLSRGKEFFNKKQESNKYHKSENILNKVDMLQKKFSENQKNFIITTTTTKTIIINNENKSKEKVSKVENKKKSNNNDNNGRIITKEINIIPTLSDKIPINKNININNMINNINNNDSNQKQTQKKLFQDVVEYNNINDIELNNLDNIEDKNSFKEAINIIMKI